MPMKNQTIFRFNYRKPSKTDEVKIMNFSKSQALATYYRKEACPKDCNNSFVVRDVYGNVRTCPKVIGGSSRCVPLSGNTMINANVPTQANGFPTKKYYTSNTEYMKARCKTYQQRQFNFTSDGGDLQANCCGNQAGYVSGNCRKVVYKPNNKPFSVQGAVSSGSRLLRLKYNTIAKNQNGVKYPPNYNTNSNMVKDAFCNRGPTKNKKTIC